MADQNDDDNRTGHLHFGKQMITPVLNFSYHFYLPLIY